MSSPTSETEIDIINAELEGGEQPQSPPPSPCHFMEERPITNVERLSQITHIPIEAFVMPQGPNGTIFWAGWDEYRFEANQIIQTSRSAYE